MNLSRIVLLEFDSKPNDLGKGKKISDGLSAVLQIGKTLWVANDESIRLERLGLDEIVDTGYCHGKDHKQFKLAEYLELPAAKGEADLEGLAYADGYLWLVGSHSLKRKKPKPDNNGDYDYSEVDEKLAELEGGGNRYLLARIPVENDADGVPCLQKTSGKRRAARLRGDAFGDDLTLALRGDKHLSPFLPIPPTATDDPWRGIPGKDNGFDIEGLATVGKRLFIGLRGPVLRGWAVVLEVEPVEDGDGSSWLRLKPVGPNGQLYRKHFLQLGGLGVRDLCAQGSDLLVLAGPTMDLDGPSRLFLWPGGAEPQAEAETVARSGQSRLLLDLPFGEGEDHAEGIGLFDCGGGGADAVIVVYDAASKRRQSGENTLLADVFTLPAV